MAESLSGLNSLSLMALTTGLHNNGEAPPLLLCNDTDDDDETLSLSLSTLSLSPTHRIEQRLSRAIDEARMATMDENRAETLLALILACQRELREWAEEGRRKRVDESVPYMTQASAKLREALHRRKHPRCLVQSVADCHEHRTKISRLISSFTPITFDGDASAADAILASLDEELRQTEALWERPDAESRVPKLIAWLEAPVAWAQPVAGAAEAHRLRVIAKDAELVSDELWRQLHNYRYPACDSSSHGSCPHHHHRRNDHNNNPAHFTDPRAISTVAQKLSSSAISSALDSLSLNL